MNKKRRVDNYTIELFGECHSMAEAEQECCGIAL